MITKSPECVAGKHDNCHALGWDDVADTFGVCPCVCHDKDRPETEAVPT